MLLNIFAASTVVKILNNRRLFVKAIGGLIIILMISTGVYDLYILGVKNKETKAIMLEEKSDIEDWIRDNCDSKDIFVTANYYLGGGDGSHVIMSGAMLYLGWQYFGWSAGYPTDERLNDVIAVYSASDEKELREATEKIGADYIIIDIVNRTSDYYEVNEELIRNTCREVFTKGEGDYKFSIFKVN